MHSEKQQGKRFRTPTKPKQNPFLPVVSIQANPTSRLERFFKRKTKLSGDTEFGNPRPGNGVSQVQISIIARRPCQPSASGTGNHNRWKNSQTGEFSTQQDGHQISHAPSTGSDKCAAHAFETLTLTFSLQPETRTTNDREPVQLPLHAVDGDNDIRALPLGTRGLIPRNLRARRALLHKHLFHSLIKYSQPCLAGPKTHKRTLQRKTGRTLGGIQQSFCFLVKVV